MYYNGDGVTQSFEESAVMYEKTAKLLSATWKI
jgi:TPR repeat protein